MDAEADAAENETRQMQRPTRLRVSPLVPSTPSCHAPSIAGNSAGRRVCSRVSLDVFVVVMADRCLVWPFASRARHSGGRPPAASVVHIVRHRRQSTTSRLAQMLTLRAVRAAAATTARTHAHTHSQTAGRSAAAAVARAFHRCPHAAIMPLSVTRTQHKQRSQPAARRNSVRRVDGAVALTRHAAVTVAARWPC